MTFRVLAGIFFWGEFSLQNSGDAWWVRGRVILLGQFLSRQNVWVRFMGVVIDRIERFIECFPLTLIRSQFCMLSIRVAG